MSLVDRTVTEVRAAKDQRRPREARPLKEYRDLPAYVLLGDPGAGKTTAFETECETLSDRALRITARDFTTFDPGCHPDWRDKILFIDGLDEIRAGSSDARTPFDEIRRRLDKLGKPRFRLSCRAADWLGENDRRNLAAVAPEETQVVLLRLDSLTAADVERILDDRTDTSGARAFIGRARERGIEGLLENPQSLLLLSDVVGIGKEGQKESWPASRLELFEQAGLLLAREHNDEHHTADPQPPPAELLDAAGRLCAVHLVSGATGYALDRGQVNAEYLDISQCVYEGHQLVRSALSTRLFTAKAEGCFAPIHRHIAEFVGARHLARVIREGLPASRVMALLVGFGGGVVTSLRGLAAWLAALSEGARRDLIERDPIGVISYGDACAFSTEHKEILLRALGREESRLDSFVWTESALSAVAARGMEPALRKILEFRNEHPPMLIAFVLVALQHGQRLPSLAESLMQVVYGDNRWADHPALALEAFLHNHPDQDAGLSRLEQLLQDLSTGRVKDSEDHLKGVALLHLYPDRIPPAKIWDYLTESTNRYPDDFGSFWRSGLINRSKPDDIAILLDELVKRRPDLKPALESRDLEEAPSDLLARGLELCGDNVEHKRLVDWLRMDPFSDPSPTLHQATERIRVWLGVRPEIQKAIVADYVNRSEFPSINYQVEEILYGSSPPPGFGGWCFGRARVAMEPRIAEVYLRLALAHGVPLDVLLKFQHETPPLREIMMHMTFCALPEGFYDGIRKRRGTWQDESRRRRGEFVAQVRSHEGDLQANRCSPPLLDELANVYFGGSSDVRGHNPEDRLRDLFGDETRLIDATLAGFRGAPFRGDIPKTHDIVGVLKTGRRYQFARPVLAGIEELDDLRELSDRQLRQALAFHFTTFTEHARNRVRRMIEVNNTAAAEVLVQCTTARMRVGKYDDTVGYELADGDCTSLASLAVMPILRAFSIRRVQPKTVTMLEKLFVAALRRVDRTTFLALVAEKLANTSMSAAQRVRWLAVQAVADPDTGIDCLRKFVTQPERRTAQLAAFLLRIGPLLDDLPTPTLATLIELLGRRVAPWPPDFSAKDVVPGSDATCVRRMMQTLAARPDRDTADELGRLCMETTLGKWYPALVDARDRQQVILRDAAYQHPTAEQVCRTLNAGTPANAGDLAALLTDRFFELARRIRTGNTDDWRQYWNETRGQEPTPKHEDHCRDALLSDLRPRLPAGVDAQPEGQYANDKRADIRVAFQDFEVPVEIKKNRHRDLWSAARNQLVAKYTSAPTTSGYGIYLVFWLGEDKMPPPPTGAPPSGPDELRQRLEAFLSDAERRKISVVVIDVSRP